jgi:hypothetical protein
VKLSNDGEVFVRLSSTPPPHRRLSWSLFEGPPLMYSDLIYDPSVISTPQPLDRTVAHRQPTEALVSVRGLFLLFWDYWHALCLCFCLYLYMGLR